MSWFRNLWKRLFPAEPKADQAAPSWANFFSDQQYRHFLSLVEGYFKQKKTPYRLGDGVVFLHEDEVGGNHQLGLFNLAQLCARQPRDEWSGIVEDHFQTMEKSQREQRVLEER